MIATCDLSSFTHHKLEDGSLFFSGRLPASLTWDQVFFETVWGFHPEKKHVIMMHGRLVETPRWQQAFGRDYHYTGRNNGALPIPEGLLPLLLWSQSAIDEKLNGLLLNWYEGPEHYIGPHHDSRKNMVKQSSIVTVSFGETRIFRLTYDGALGKVARDFEAHDGTVFVMPYETNIAWKHGVPKSQRFKGRRISVTLRAFEP